MKKNKLMDFVEEAVVDAKNDANQMYDEARNLHDITRLSEFFRDANQKAAARLFVTEAALAKLKRNPGMCASELHNAVMSAVHGLHLNTEHYQLILGAAATRFCAELRTEFSSLARTWYSLT